MAIYNPMLKDTNAIKRIGVPKPTMQQQSSQQPPQAPGMQPMQQPQQMQPMQPRPIQRPPMVPTNNPGAIRTLGATPQVQQKIVLPNTGPSVGALPSSPQGTMQAQTMGPGGGVGNVSGAGGAPGTMGNMSNVAPQLGASLQHMIDSHFTNAGTPNAGSVNVSDPSQNLGPGQTPVVQPAPPPGSAPGAGHTDATQAPLTQADIDQARDSAIAKLFSQGGLDTSSQEALIQQIMGDQIGAGEVNARASMGRAGFGSSGAESGLEADTNRQAREAALQSIFGVREQASNDFRQNVGTAAQMDQAAQDEAFTQWLRQQLITNGNAPTDPNADPLPGALPGGGQHLGGSVYGHDRDGSLTMNADGTGPDPTKSYPGGVDAFTKAENDGHDAALRYAVDNKGDYGGLPHQSPTATSVKVADDPATGDTVYYDPATKKLFNGGK